MIASTRDTTTWHQQAPRRRNVFEKGLLRSCEGRSYFGVGFWAALPNVNVNCQTNTGDTPLHIAVRTDTHRNALSKVKTLIQRGADPQIDNYQGWSPFRMALTFKMYDTVYYMCYQNDLLINAYDKRGETASHQCCREGDLLGLQIVLLAGGNPDLLTDRGFSCLDIAVMGQSTDLVRELLLHNCKPVLHFLGYPEQACFPPHFWYTFQTFPEIVRLLLEAGCPLRQYRRFANNRKTIQMLQKSPSLQCLCCVAVRTSINKAYKWKKGASVQDRVRSVIEHYLYQLPGCLGMAQHRNILSAILLFDQIKKERDLTEESEQFWERQGIHYVY